MVHSATGYVENVSRIFDCDKTSTQRSGCCSTSDGGIRIDVLKVILYFASIPIRNRCNLSPIRTHTQFCDSFWILRDLFFSVDNEW